VDLEKAFDMVPREVIRWAMHKLGVAEWLVSAVMSMYTGAKTVVRTVYGNSNSFEIKVGMHQGSALSPLLFVTVVEALSREFRVTLPCELLYADDLAVIAETVGLFVCIDIWRLAHFRFWHAHFSHAQISVMSKILKYN